MDKQTTERIRDRVWHSVNPHTAAVAGLSVQALQQFCVGAVYPDDEHLAALARHFNIREEAR